MLWGARESHLRVAEMVANGRVLTYAKTWLPPLQPTVAMPRRMRATVAELLILQEKLELLCLCQDQATQTKRVLDGLGPGVASWQP